MKKAIAEKWVKALRSGDYLRGEGQLRTRENEFCCLGVLCNIHAQENPKIAQKQDKVDSYNGSESVPPPLVMRWSGLKSQLGDIEGIADSLAEMNDNGKNFFEIADIIEENWRKL